MPFSDDRLREMQEAYKEDFGEEISLAEASEILFRLVTFYELISRPLPREEESATQGNDTTAPDGQDEETHT